MSHSILGIRGRPLLLCLCAFVGVAGLSAAAFAADKPKQEISHTIGKEMNAAQKTIAVSQWAEALKNLEAAEAKSGLTNFDKFKINDFKAFIYIKMNNMKAAQTAIEAAMAT